MSTELANELHAEWLSTKNGATLLELRNALAQLGKSALRGTKIGSAYAVMEITVSDLIAELIEGIGFEADKGCSFSTYCFNRIEWDLKENRRDPNTRAESLEQRKAKRSEDPETGIENAPWEPSASVHNIGFGAEEYIPETLTPQEKEYVSLVLRECPDEKWEVRRKPRNIAKMNFKVPDREIAEQMNITTKQANRLRQSVQEKFKADKETRSIEDRPIGNRPPLTFPVRVCKDWAEWQELVSHVFPGVWYPNGRSA